MRKLTFLLVISICISMLGCSTTEQENTAQTTKQPTESTAMTDAPTEVSESNILPTESGEVPVKDNAGGGDVSLLGISTLEEYEKHFEKNGGYPESFVTYENLCELGTFDDFVCQSYNLMEGARKEYNTYQYGFVVDGIRFVLKIRPAKLVTEFEKTLEWVDVKNRMTTSDLRTNQTGIGYGMVTFGEYVYEYLDGKLHAIKWIVGETRVTIWAENGWPENDPDTLIGRMLIWDTAEEALGELREKIDGKLKNVKYPD